MKSTKVLVPSGVLGLGFDLEALHNGVKNNPDINPEVFKNPLFRK